MLHFATLFDKNYLSRGICLFNSLEKTMINDFHLYIMTLDEHVNEYFTNYQDPRITLININQVENHFPELLVAKKNRSLIEYYFTLSPILPLYILENFDNCNRITTLDADIYFYSSPEEIFKQYNDNSVLITPHDFTPKLNHFLINGKYNVSFQSFPNTENGRAVLKDWKMKCLDWCKDSLDPITGNFADQKYLDTWEKEFNDVEVINLKTCGRAPWNIASTNLTYTNKKLMVDGEPLIYYHYHHLRIYEHYVSHNLQVYGVFRVNRPLRIAYSIYVKSLLKLNNVIGQHNDVETIRITKPVQKSVFSQLWNNETGAIMIFNRIVFYNFRIIKKIIQKTSQKLKWQN